MASASIRDALIVDVDDPSTWPPAIARRVRELAAGRVSDLQLVEGERAFRASLSGCLLRAYHCTRLLDHEVAMLRNSGLRLLTRELPEERIKAAHAAGSISDDERDALRGAHMFAIGEHRMRGSREDQTCLVVSRQTLDSEADGIAPLLSSWGGEVLYRSSGAQPVADLLGRLGRPTVVVALLDLSADRHGVYPGVLATFLHVATAAASPGSDVFYRDPVPREQIEAFWQPGNPEYDRHTLLPRL